jgi:glycosyltransferase involved in cell wall biosynthesis
MRIAELVNSLTLGGAERMVTNLSLGLAARGHQVTVICLRGAGPLEEPLRAAGIEVMALGKGEGFSCATASRLARLLKERRIEVVHTHNPLVHHYGVLAGRLAGVHGVVSTVHGLNNLEKRGKGELLYLAMSLWTSRIVSVCRMAEEFFRRTLPLPKNRMSVIYNGIPLEPFLRVAPRPPDGEFVFGAVGRLVPIKDHAGLLEAFREVAARHPRCRLEILGDGPLRRELEERRDRLGLAGRVEFRGASADAAAFLGRVDAFVLSSESEGLPMTLMEAMAAGLPTVATAVGGIPEFVEGARSGWLAPPRAPAALAAAMMAAVEADDRAERGARGREFALARCSLETMAMEYERLFAGLPPRAAIRPKEAHAR